MNTTEERREWWKRLSEAESGSTADFYRLYASYLRWENELSPNRRLLVRMADRVSKGIK